MATTIVGGGKHDILVYGSGTVIAGDGNDTITIDGKQGKIEVGNGNDSIYLANEGHVTVGSGHDKISLVGSGTVTEYGKHGNDTIYFGAGNDTIFEAGEATVHGLYGKAFIDGGTAEFTNTARLHVEDAVSGHVTLVGGISSNEFIGGSGHTSMTGGTGADTFIGGTGHDTMHGGSNTNIFEFLSSDAGGTHVINNFVSGQDQLYLEGYSLAYLQSHHDIKVSGGNTYISLDHGKTMIELKGVTNLSDTDVKHKP